MMITQVSGTSNRTLLQWFTFPFYLFLETARIAGFSWMKYGTEQILFSTKLWHKLAQFSILFLIKLTGAQKREPSYTVGGNANYYSHYGEHCGDSLKNWK